MNIVKLFALSTCIWCRKTENMLKELGCEYTLVYMDNLSDVERKASLRELEQYNSNRSFPTLVIDEKKIIVGFKPAEIRSALTR